MEPLRDLTEEEQEKEGVRVELLQDARTREMLTTLQANLKMGEGALQSFDHSLADRSSWRNSVKVDRDTFINGMTALRGFSNLAQRIIAGNENIVALEKRRKDDWDIFYEKLENDPMANELWKELMI